ncbi:hypothetical protein DBR43_26950 [Pedobacter sp. KBW06]|uniref:isochorismatase family cysteine hydrolase n=1 Tax=Pedobacter sp. KBW06 TaxID=2153359 RepID=UPI000F59F19D|nr:isochorismatase family cysteine hydrolase [Pedobacter sp. KBW06]RQO65890.1 hypothetical protein DBR43_26950 [Pedobacter sp. KBW06]
MRITKEQLLVIIDPQKDFINPDGAYAKRHSGIRQILECKRKINELLAETPAERLLVIYSDYLPNQFGAGLSMAIPGTSGHQIDIAIQVSHRLIAKTAHSSFSSEEFSSHLEKNNIKELILCGFLAEYCVKQTAIDGLSRGYKVSVLSELTGTGDDVQERKAQALKELQQYPLFSSDHQDFKRSENANSADEV